MIPSKLHAIKYKKMFLNSFFIFNNKKEVKIAKKVRTPTVKRLHKMIVSNAATAISFSCAFLDCPI